MHFILWVIGAAFTILLFGGIIAIYHYYADISARRAAEQREVRFAADALELEERGGDPARRPYFWVLSSTDTVSLY